MQNAQNARACAELVQQPYLFSILCACLDVENPAEAARSYSSVYNNNAIGTGMARSMLDSVQAWSAATNDVNQWMQIDLGALRSVAGVVTQGRQDQAQWVTGYTVSTSTDGSTWTPVNNGQQLSGNTDQSTKVRHAFSSVSARYIRFYVKTWHNRISMRAGVIISGYDVPGITHHAHAHPRAHARTCTHHCCCSYPLLFPVIVQRTGGRTDGRTI